MVSYANEDILIYFIVFPAEFANIERDVRVSLVIGRDFHDPLTSRPCRSPRAHPRCAIRSNASGGQAASRTTPRPQKA